MKTRYISWDEAHGYKKDELEYAAGVLREGGLVAFPTETVYGLGGNGLMKEASVKIYEAKGRPSDNPLILHISSRQELEPIVRGITPEAEALMEAFWPGPMTLIFQKAPEVPLETTGDGSGTDAISCGRQRTDPSGRCSGSGTQRQHIRQAESYQSRACKRRPGWQDRCDHRRRPGRDWDRVYDHRSYGGCTGDPAAGIYYQSHGRAGGRRGPYGSGTVRKGPIEAS